MSVVSMYAVAEQRGNSIAVRSLLKQVAAK